ncbi:MAG TPA: peptidylprolyl isomerase [Longimicrobiaceae bacterium]|nr:peptidylprolyl isomerase [Longimicrobiaceae bacterium]
MMKDMREKMVPIMVVVALAFVGLMVFQWGMDISGGSSRAQNGELGRVNGTPVTYREYEAVYEQLTQQARQQAGGPLSSDQTKQLGDRAFNQVVEQILLQQAMQDRGIGVSDAEIRQAALVNPPPELASNELFQTNGQFDLGKWQRFLASPSANSQLLLQLENYYREAIPRAKLIRQVTAGTWVTDAQLWQMWKDRNETATVDYVALDLSKLVPGDVPVSDSEIKAYYDAHRDEFKRPATARFSIAVLSKTPTAADTAATLEHAESVRKEIEDGGDFAAIAKRESADKGTKEQGGELGTFVRGQMVPQFDSVAFSLPVGQISQPVLSPFGYHLIQVEAHRGDSVQARHILIPVEMTDSALDVLYARADTLEALAPKAGLTRAARATHASVRTDVTVSETQPFVPGIGSASEAIDWARDQAKDNTGVKVSPLFETDEAFYLVQTDAFSPAGETPLNEATPRIRRELILQKKRAQAKKIGEQIVAAVRGGKSLEDAAKAHGLSVESYGPFTRLGPNPAFGQASAAVGAAFGTPVGKVSDVVESPAGLFIVRPTAHTEADRKAFEARKDQLREAVTAQAQQQDVARFMDSLRKSAKIVDNRDQVLKQS